MFIPRLFVFTLLTAALAGHAATISYSPPVGGAQITFEPGPRFTGMPFVNPAVQHGVVVSNTSNIITLDVSEINMAAILASDTAYYLEVVAGPDVTFIGERFEVHVPATVASANATITIDTESTTNTLESLPDDLAGYRIVVRPHITIGQLFGTKGNELLHGSANLTTSDQVVFLDAQTQSYQTYFYLRNASGSIARWTLVGGGSTNRDNTPIPPGMGMIVHRNAESPATLTWVGEIRTNSFAQPLFAGLNLIAEPYPVTNTPLQRGLTYNNGVEGSANLSSSDQISIFNGIGYDTYFLLRNASGSIERWTLVGGGSTNHNDTKLFEPTSAVILRKLLADKDYFIPYSLNL